MLGHVSQVHGSAALCSLLFWWPQRLCGLGLGQPYPGKPGKLPTFSKGILMLAPSVITLLMCFSMAGYCTPPSAFPSAVKQARLLKFSWDALSLSPC